jgi:hypothetical protein
MVCFELLFQHCLCDNHVHVCDPPCAYFSGARRVASFVSDRMRDAAERVLRSVRVRNSP